MQNRFLFFFLFIIYLLHIIDGYAQHTTNKERVIVLTDICNEPDDEESLVRFLVYSNEFDVEGLVATTSCWLKQGVREDKILSHLHAYEKVLNNLKIHAGGFPSKQYLESVTCSGQTEYGLQATGKGKTTKGSELLIKAAMKKDPRPLWILIWGGANTLAQALKDARLDLNKEDFNYMLSKMRIYSISDQDDAGPWIRKEFPSLFFIVDPSNPDAQDYYCATWNGISGDMRNKIEVGYYSELVDNPWLEKNIINNHGPLGKCYPRLAFIMEGDTPSFLGLINNGLGWTERPDYGGWGGRYQLYKAYGETRPIWTSNKSSRDTFEYEEGKFYTSNRATIWRWRNHFQYDFAARMDWCIADKYEKANHNPIVVVNGDSTKNVIYMEAELDEKIILSAKGTHDPDNDSLSVFWWIYEEVSSAKNAVLSSKSGMEACLDLSTLDKDGDVHVIVQVNDNGTPNLYAYRRIVITVNPKPSV